MFKHKTIIGSLLLLVLAGGLARVAPGQTTAPDNPLASTFEAHGGLDLWRKFGRMTYELNGFPLSPQVAKPNRSTVDLRTRRNRIESEEFVVGRAVG